MSFQSAPKLVTLNDLELLYNSSKPQQFVLNSFRGTECFAIIETVAALWPSNQSRRNSN